MENLILAQWYLESCHRSMFLTLTFVQVKFLGERPLMVLFII